MIENEDRSKEQQDSEGLSVGRPVSRREFLKIAGIAGAAVGVGGGLGGLVAACGGGTTTTTAAATTTSGAATTTTGAAGSTTTAPASTSTSASAEAGREVKIGVISPLTGALAVFAVSDKWGLDLVKQYVGDTVVLGDGKSHKVSWLLRDTQSDDNRASQVTGDLINNDKADLLVVGGSPTTAVPAAVQAETLGAPLLGMNCPWQAWAFARYPDLKDITQIPDKWSYGLLFGIEQGTTCMVQVLNKIPTNKKAGLFLGNTIDTDAWLSPGIGMKDMLESNGYQTILPSKFNLGTEDFTSLISAYKKFGCEINVGSNPGKDFPNFWTQAHQQGYAPKACVEMIGLAATSDQEAAGPSAYGVIMIFTWHKDWSPYKDSITGLTNPELADLYEKDLNKPWDQFITGYARMGWALDVLKRTTNVDDKNSVVTAIKTTKTELITGPVDFTSSVDPKGLHIAPTIYKTPVALGQMQKGVKWPVDVPMVALVDGPGIPASNVHQPFTIGVGPQQVS